MRNMRDAGLVVLALCGAGVLVAGAAPAGVSESLMAGGAAAQVVTVEGVTVTSGVVTGRLVNHGGRLLRDVRLLIRYQWLWNNERNPGSDNPGRAVFHTVEAEVPAAGGELAFTYRPSPALPVRPDGRFEVAVEIVGFTEVAR